VDQSRLWDERPLIHSFLPSLSQLYLRGTRSRDGTMSGRALSEVFLGLAAAAPPLETLDLSFQKSLTKYLDPEALRRCLDATRPSLRRLVCRESALDGTTLSALLGGHTAGLGGLHLDLTGAELVATEDLGMVPLALLTNT
jgi:hypothetical protein